MITDEDIAELVVWTWITLAAICAIKAVAREFSWLRFANSLNKEEEESGIKNGS